MRPMSVHPKCSCSIWFLLLYINAQIARFVKNRNFLVHDIAGGGNYQEICQRASVEHIKKKIIALGWTIMVPKVYSKASKSKCLGNLRARTS